MILTALPFYSRKPIWVLQTLSTSTKPLKKTWNWPTLGFWYRVLSSPLASQSSGKPFCRLSKRIRPNNKNDIAPANLIMISLTCGLKLSLCRSPVETASKNGAYHTSILPNLSLPDVAILYNALLGIALPIIVRSVSFTCIYCAISTW